MFGLNLAAILGEGILFAGIALIYIMLCIGTQAWSHGLFLLNQNGIKIKPQMSSKIITIMNILLNPLVTKVIYTIYKKMLYTFYYYCRKQHVFIPKYIFWACCDRNCSQPCLLLVSQMCNWWLVLLILSIATVART